MGLLILKSPLKEMVRSMLISSNSKIAQMICKADFLSIYQSGKSIP
jgi:hypothetical protein